MRERELAASSWLLLSASDSETARQDWRTHGLALLTCGPLLTAVRVPAGLVHAAAGSEDREDAERWLARGLEGGPVFYDGVGNSYFALNPPSAAEAWRQQAVRVPGVEVLEPGSLLGVPATDITQADLRRWVRWAVPMDGPGVLCLPSRVLRLVRAGEAALEAREA
ncbi:hypothetical protein [Streptomyces zhihengii]|uniref:hypothetical protein n=1 Tax=Streptomyces zhihengii TaxID=1818004 RepID=UPI0033A80A1E